MTNPIDTLPREALEPSIEVQAAEDLRAFALEHNALAFAHLVTAALDGEPWAITRVAAVLTVVRHPRNGSLSVLAAIRATDTTRPNGALKMPPVRLEHPQLTARAIAVLVALRNEGRSLSEICHAIAEPTPGAARSTVELIRDMEKAGLVAPMIGGAWRLAEDGLAWLQTNGLDATPYAKREIYPE